MGKYADTVTHPECHTPQEVKMSCGDNSTNCI